MVFMAKILSLLVLAVIIVIYFQIYWHYWLVKLLGGYVVNTFLPVIFLFCVFTVGFVSMECRILKRKTNYLQIPLLYYVFFATVSIFLNEEGFQDVKAYLIYVYSPILILTSIWGLYIYKKTENIVSLLNILFIVGVVFSIYVAMLFTVDPVGLLNMPTLETNRGDIATTTGGSYGIGDLTAIRYTIPGISSTTYGPLLVPLIFIGFYFRKNTSGKRRYFYTFLTFFLIVCVFMTVSRGPLVSLIAGTIYLVWWKWFKRREKVFIIVFFVIAFFTFAKLIFLRLIMTVAMVTPMDLSFLANTSLEDPRLMSIKETVSYISFFGIGMSNLIKAEDISYGKDHNNYLSIAASFGIVALVFYVIFIVSLFIGVYKFTKKLPLCCSEKDVGIILGAGLLSLMVYLNFAPAEFHFIWIWFGLVGAWLRNCEDGFFSNK